jgi:Tol biopolymer transport system component
MTDELRGVLDETVSMAPPPEPDLDSVIRQGRRRRITNLVTFGTAIAVFLGAVTFLGVELVEGHDRSLAPTGVGEADDYPIVAAVTEVSGGDSRLIAINTSGKTTELFDPSDSGGESAPAWSSNGSRIAFARDVNPAQSMATLDSNMEIFVANADGSGLTRLTHHPGADTAPAWSPDGTRITFSRNLDGNDELYVMNQDGSGLRRLTNNEGPDALADWSPDGLQLAYVSNVAGQVDLFLISPDGAEPEPLTKDAAVEGNPVWSPDGRTLAYRPQHFSTMIRFLSLEDRSTHSIDVANSFKDGAGPEQLHVVDVAWSPDGEKIAAVLRGPGRGQESSVVIYREDGTQVGASQPFSAIYGIDWR